MGDKAATSQNKLVNHTRTHTIPKDYWWIAYPTSTEFSIQSGADCTYFVELRRPVRKRIAANGGGVLLEALLLK